MLLHIRLSTILHISSAARAGTAQPRFRQISNIARRILHTYIVNTRFLR